MPSPIYLASFYYDLNIPITVGGLGASLILVYFLRHLHWGLALALGVVSGGLLGVGVGWAGEGDMEDLVQIAFGLIGAVSTGILSLIAALMTRSSRQNQRD
ncbi:MAG: hypothetical protein H2076_08560 [Planctomycetes bacterium]|nr:hypothetical protein [Planctomycetota bacterium]